ncbi:MAG: DUF554 domain-containing protein [Brevinematales bacterium]|jgi:uncharacterized membrane protein YqgA involved in biofilm formation
MFLGTIVNTAAVMAGSLAGIILSGRIPPRLSEIILQALGLCTLAIGISMILKTENILILIFSLIIGGIAGELCRLQERLDGLGETLKKKLKSSNSKFTEGMTGSFLIFCIGSMTILGSLQEGLYGDHTLLFTKSILDGFAAIALGAAYGSGVFFSAFALLIYQCLLTYLARLAGGLFPPYVINQIIAMGGLLILGIGFNLLDIKKIKTTNLLPGLVFVVLLSFIFGK